MKNPKKTALISTWIFVLLLVVFSTLPHFDIPEINNIRIEAILAFIFFLPLFISLWFWSGVLKLSSSRWQEWYISLRFAAVGLTIFCVVQITLFFLGVYDQ